ncbi:hypothetical protein AJ88_37580 [Mesorhizobium amorphae CCBAU 01583]|nr:hypothetical protein AJ88_37580 [Mesorhizobium amorphae CCBAU 01583]
MRFCEKPPREPPTASRPPSANSSTSTPHTNAHLLQEPRLCVWLIQNSLAAGKVDYDAHMSHVAILGEGLLSRTRVLTRSRADAAVAHGAKLRENVGFRRAAVDVTRELVVIMYAMVKPGELFNREETAIA